MPLVDGPEWLLRVFFFSALLGFPVAAVLAWFYEFTPEGVKTDREAAASPAVRFTGRKIDFLIIGLLVLVVGFLLVDDADTPVATRSIAVLPFDNRSIGEENAAFFADGIHDDLIILLSKFSDIRVISRKSVERFKGTDQSLRQIADALGVSTILEGGLRVAAGRVRINVQLIEVATETDLWAEIYDRKLTATNIFGIQSEVALNIVGSLKATLSPSERERLDVIPTKNLQAYEAFVQGRQAMAKRTIDSMQAAVEQFKRAIELDAEFALAYVGLADSYAVQENWGYSPSEYVRPLIRAAATKALELDDQLGEAYVSIAPVYEMEGNFAAAEAAYVRAIELSPGYATAHSWYGLLLRWRLGRVDEAVEQAEQALILDPLSAVLRMAYGDLLFALGRFDDAVSQYVRSIELDPDFGGSHKMLGDVHLYAHRQSVEAIESYGNAVAIAPDPDWIGDIGSVYLVLGDYAEAEIWMERARLADPENIFLNRHLALLSYYQGRDDAAEEFAQKYLEGPIDVFVPYMLHILRNGEMEKGRYADIRRRYEEYSPALAEPEPVVHRSNYRAAIDLSVVLEKMGETQRAQQLLDKSLLVTRNMPRLGVFGYGSAQAEILALQGNADAALQALQAAVDDGWWPHWYFWLELNPNLDSIRDLPAYRELVTSLESSTSAELARAQASQVYLN